MSFVANKSYIQYAQDVLSGNVVAGEYIRLAAERFFRLMEDGRYEFRAGKVDEVIDFVHVLKHYTGRHSGKPFVLQPWQEFIVAGMYGFYVKEDGQRLVKSAYIEMARKQGKTAFASGLCLYHLIGEGEANAEVYLAANSKDQAKIAFKMCSTFVKGMDPKKRYLVPYRDYVSYDATNSLLRVLAADDSKLDGFNASMYLLDEFQAAKNNKLKNVLQSSQGMRDNPMEVIITTAGFDKLGPCYEYRTRCTEVLKGLKEDDTMFIAIYSLDEGDDWRDESVWVKSNPNLNVTVRPNYIREQVRKAVNMPSEEVGVKTKNINMWCDSETVWIPEHYLLDASVNINIDDFTDYEAFLGIDLSSTSDLTSLSCLIPDYEKRIMYFKTWYYLPESALKEKRFKELYGEWRRQGLITITPGNVTDYDYILNEVLRLREKLFIHSVGYDAWNATQFVIDAEDAGVNMRPISQSISNFNRPTKEMERLLLSGRAKIDNNPINRHCYRNVVLKTDYNNNAKPVKQFEEKKIDGVISQLNALAAYQESPRWSATF